MAKRLPFIPLAKVPPKIFWRPLESDVVNADGSNLVHLSDSVRTHQASVPAWSPDSQYVAFDAFGAISDNDEIPDVYVASVDGSSLIRITDDQTPGFMPQWSPDGLHVAFVSANPLFDASSYVIYATKSDGSDRKIVAKGKGLVWSPDGLQLAFISTEDGEIYIVGVDGLRTAQITDLDGEKTLLDWLP